jgi:hypothetical protein
MSDSNLTESQLKKKQANQKYREKIRQQLEMTQKSHDAPKVEDAPQDASQDAPQDAQDASQDGYEDAQDEAEEYVLDKKTYNYLLEMARLGQEQEAQPEQPPKPTKPKPDPVEPKQQEDGFFFLVKNQFKATAISLLPILTLQVAMHGGKLLANWNSTSQSNNASNQSKKPQQQYTQEFVLPSVNSL